MLGIPGIIEIDMQVREDRAPGFHPCDPGERRFDIGVRGMGRVAKRVENPAVESFKRRERVLRSRAKD